MTKEDLVLMTLSFYEPMTFEKIILDISKEDLDKVGDFNREELLTILNNLLKEKKVSQTKNGKETLWVKNLPKKKLLRRIFDMIFAN